MKKVFLTGILFVLLSLTSFNGTQRTAATTDSILYVGGSGSGNYSTIQSALNASEDGDIIFVFSGIYNEKLYVSNEVQIIGESKNSTIVSHELHDFEELVSIESNNITISNLFFKVKKGENTFSCINIDADGIDGFNLLNNKFFGDEKAGIWITHSVNCKIQNNTLVDTCEGIRIENSNDLIISNNYIHNSGINIIDSENISILNNSIIQAFVGISLDGVSSSTVSENIINSLDYGIIIYKERKDIFIEYNFIENIYDYVKQTHYGILIRENIGNILISNNSIKRFNTGIYLWHSVNTSIAQNNFMLNRINAKFNNTLNDKWDNNYWGRPKFFPKLILGTKDFPSTGYCFEFDWHPAKKPIILKIKS